MKKILLTTALLSATAGMAAAEGEVSFSGYGRFGLVHDSSVGAGTKETQVHTRLRFNINAKVETDAGVTFGGRIRMQHTAGSSGGAGLNAAYVYASYEG
ncbi:MAG: porin, partial [Paracoccaceae bacterium]